MNLTTEPCRHAHKVLQTSNITVIPRILIVDDETSIREFIGEVLNESDYYIADKVAGAEEALRMLRSRHYDVLLTDYHMPKMTGSQLISKMRSEGIDIPVILMTGQRDELLARYPDLRVNALLAKPFMIEEMMGALTGVLNAGPAGIATASKLVNLSTETHESRRTVFF